MPRAKFEPTDTEREQVLALAQYGIPQDQICLLIKRPFGKEKKLKPISVPTLTKYFSEELAEATPKLISMVAQALATTALDRKHPGHVRAATFLLKARAGWSERSEVEVNGSIGFDIDFEGATLEELAVLERFLKRRAMAHGGDPQAANAA